MSVKPRKGKVPLLRLRRGTARSPKLHQQDLRDTDELTIRGDKGLDGVQDQFKGTNVASGY